MVVPDLGVIHRGWGYAVFFCKYILQCKDKNLNKI